MDINQKPNLWVGIVGVVVGFLLALFVPPVSPAGVMVFLLALLLWLLKPGRSGNWLSSLVGIAIGLVVSLLLPQVAFAGMFDEGIAAVGVFLLLASGDA